MFLFMYPKVAREARQREESMALCKERCLVYFADGRMGGWYAPPESIHTPAEKKNCY